MPTADPNEDIGGAALGDAPTDDAPVAGLAGPDDDADDADDAPSEQTRPTRGAIKASTREFARKIAEAHKGKVGSDGVLDVGLKPVIGEPAKAPAAGAPPAAKVDTPAKAPDPAPGAPAAPPAELVAAWEAVNAAKAEAQQLAAEAKAARERVDKYARGKLLGSGEEMHGAITALLRDEIGEGATDDEVTGALSDLVTELSLRLAGVSLPANAKRDAETRQALRLLKRHQREADRTAKEAAARAKADEERRQRLTSAEQIGKEITKTPDAYRFLQATTDDERDGLTVGEFIVTMIEERWKHDRTRLTWGQAAELADTYFKQAAQRQHGRWAPLLTPPAVGGGAAPTQGAPQGDRSAQVPRTLRNVDASEPPSEPPPDPSARFDPDEHRRRTAAKWSGKIGKRPAAE